MSLSVHQFAAFHHAVHAREPFAWQSRLLAQIVAERSWPGALDLPTGAGKTTCIDIAIFALALDAQKQPSERWCPRRIAMVVDRRIVVDQATERGRSILRALVAQDRAPIVAEVTRLLHTLSPGEEEPLGVYTLRGGIPKDDGWARTPHQPLVLASTVDQLGSRLLVQGYGVSRGMKPVHAGLLGNDTLVLLDEVHLSQPFAQTLDALAALRTRFATTGLPVRFQHVFLSATPLASARQPFRLSDDEKTADSPLGPRLHAKKESRLVQEADREAVERRCIDEARTLMDRHDVVAVVVNRVASAVTIAGELRKHAAGNWDVALLTGRMRPLDRDDILESLRPRISTGRDRGSVARKLVVVGTQCIEAGADFDFDALVTECASLDALRQRFGRLDRLGLYLRAEGVIVQDKSAEDDPIYGEPLVATAKWLKDQLRTKRKVVDFGIMVLPTPPDDVLSHLVAPKPEAPSLLPAYLDLWMQTAPAAAAVPDASLWLHGPRSGPADVQVIWRADLTEADLEAALSGTADDAARGRPVAIVASVRPSSLEAISLPFAAARRWLSDLAPSEIADVEVSIDARAEEGGAPGSALRWAGDESEVITASELRPGDTIVVPTSRRGIRDGCFDPISKGGPHAPEVSDLAERASLLGRGQPVLRLHPAVLRQLGLAQVQRDLEEVGAALENLADAATDRGWRGLWLRAVARANQSFVVDGEEPWTVLRGKRFSAAELRRQLSADDTVEDGAELATDDDDSCDAGRTVELSIHSTDVEDFARRYATALGFPTAIAQDIALAAWLHDVGKADRRFQILLRGGSEITYFKNETPLAKSATPSGARAAQRGAAKKSGYPERGRHEVQSVAMIEKHSDAIRAKAHDIDLVLHLVASHHGHCRPLAPVVVDDLPVDVVLPGHRSATFGEIDFGPTSSKHDLHRLESPLADRFWSLVGRYGWLELCWLEATLRLADHRASEHEQETGDAA
jgi:CRISPR-associated endonuclease/helicase Cas3